MKKIFKNLIVLSVLTIYGSSWCHYCQLQKEELDRLHIAYNYVDASKKPKELNYINAVPILVNDKGKIQVGLLTGDELLKFVAGI